MNGNQLKRWTFKTLVSSLIRDEYIGKGFQVIVFSESESRVKKYRHPKPISFFIAITQLPFLKGEIKWSRYIEILVNGTETSFNELKEKDIDLSIVGNPERVKGVLYQDKVEPLGSMIESEGNEKIIEMYVEFLKKCVRNGFYDLSWNFTINAGFDGEKVIQIDIGELSFEKENLLVDLEKKIWLKQYSCRRDVSEEFCELLTQKISEQITPEFVKSEWGSYQSSSSASSS